VLKIFNRRTIVSGILVISSERNMWQSRVDEIGSRRALAVVMKAMVLGTKQEGKEEEWMQQQHQ
jgi:hypothetical protein